VATISHTSPPQHDQQLTTTVLAGLRVLLELERPLLSYLLAYALAIGLLSLIVPLTVQELVNTFAYAIQPITITTLAAIMVLILLTVGILRALQFYAVEMLEQRLFARIALGVTRLLPNLKLDGFKPKYANHFMETVFLQRSVSTLLTDIINVVVGSLSGMTILVLYHPAFIFFNAALLAGFATIIVLLSYGGFRATLAMSHAKYEMLNWIQEIANNLLYFKTANGQPLLLRRTDQLVTAYLAARQTRFKVLVRQYLGSVGWQALGHSGLIATAGWLMADGQLTLGQFVAAEVIVGTLLLNFDSIVKRMSHVFYFFTALAELDSLFSLPKGFEEGRPLHAIAGSATHGIRLTCRNASFTYTESSPVFQPLDLDVAPGEKVAALMSGGTGKTTLAWLLAGLLAPTNGVVLYDGVDLRDTDLDSLNECRGFVPDAQLTLFEGTLEDNVTMGRPSVTYQDIQWALRFVELEDEIGAMPLGLRTPVRARGKAFATSQVSRVLIARAIVTRPRLVILDGTLLSVARPFREIILRRLCSKEEPWTVVIVTNETESPVQVDRRIVVS
jgi:ABC-type bacteriocin/lantibiotic exporter with double-glycine peptidase domain